eukprot:CAMPEP_0118703292 /NCGR_PEP_ID=MMETSP0800-20121206/18449_1 /TAXON_ID=210618 ORGANISM="Striatella unipunctata, Strain CCMP2910" /NCGR_SAMPLE_ID=MMETSP0800 /ASSEMBLY_ACC=CAM_ASM_000638 /LENGTH=317 /DNA_ID=CAMNT_0006604755 /DNA_START=808 /DNA_END=1758 /DNA_ORIENTATION=+
MALPIALGGKTCSVTEIPEPEAHFVDEYRHGGGSTPRVAVGMNVDQSLALTMTVRFYDSLENEKVTTVLSIHVQVSILDQSSSTRTSKYRIPLPFTTRPVGEDRTYRWSHVAPCVQWTLEGRNVACLIPHPVYNEEKSNISSVMMLQIKKPRSLSIISSKPPIPSFLKHHQETTSAPTDDEKEPLPVTSNPRIVVGDRSARITSLTVAPYGKDTSFVMAGCVDGSILVLAQRKAEVSGILWKAKDSSPKIVALAHTPAIELTGDEFACGKLLAIAGDGTAQFYSTTISPSTEEDDKGDEMDTTDNVYGEANSINQEL